MMYKYNLNDVKWNEFNISEIFSFIERGRRLKVSDREDGDIPFVTAGEANNGISSFIGNLEHKLYFRAITIDMFGNSFFQRGWFKCDDSPDWRFMEEYIKERKNKQRLILCKYYKERLNNLLFTHEVSKDIKWKSFSLKSLFKFERGNQNNMSNCLEGSIPLISAKKIDNGVKSFILDNGKKLFDGNILTLNNDGDGGVGIAYYQANKIALDTHVTALIPKKVISREGLLFISRVITIQRDKFSHGYSLNNNRMMAQKIVLPIDKSGNPDFVYMENFIKNIEQKQIKSILNYLTK